MFITECELDKTDKEVTFFEYGTIRLDDMIYLLTAFC